jgi:hypothetical protein
MSATPHMPIPEEARRKLHGQSGRRIEPHVGLGNLARYGPHHGRSSVRSGAERENGNPGRSPRARWDGVPA